MIKYPNIFKLSYNAETFTGFLITNNGYLLTVSHPFNNSNNNKPVICQYGEFKFEATLIYKSNDDNKDFAIIKIHNEIKQLPAALSLFYKKIKENDEVYGYGYGFARPDLEHGSTKFDGKIGQDYIFTPHIDRPILPGDSGAPVFDSKSDKVIGLNHQRLKSTIEGERIIQGFLLPLTDICKELENKKIQDLNFNKLCERPNQKIYKTLKIVLIAICAIISGVYIYSNSTCKKYNDAIKTNTMEAFEIFYNENCRNENSKYCDSIKLKILYKTLESGYVAYEEFKRNYGNSFDTSKIVKEKYRDPNFLIIDTFINGRNEWVFCSNKILKIFYSTGDSSVKNHWSIKDTILTIEDFRLLADYYQCIIRNDSLIIMNYEDNINVKRK